MSSALAIASVTAVLRDLLNNGLIDHNVPGAVGDVTVTALPPDRIDLTASNFTSRLNLYLYKVSYNAGWRNAGLPARDSNGQRANNPPLALDLHYLLTAYGNEELHSEILLGYGMQILHETPVLTRDAIRTSLQPPTPGASLTSLPPQLQALFTSELAEQFEMIKVWPETMSAEELFNTWSAFSTSYRPSALYQASVVLIESRRPFKSALPVRARNLYVVPFKQPVVEQLRSQSAPGAPVLDQPILAGYLLVVQGQNLRGEETLLKVNGTEVTPTDVADAQVVAPLPSGLAAGVHGVQVVHRLLMGTPEVPHRGVESNIAPFVLRPRVVGPVTATNVLGAGPAPRSAEVTVTLDPAVSATQRVVLLLNEFQLPTSPPGSAPPALSYSFVGPTRLNLQSPPPSSPPGASTSITIPVSGVRAGDYLVRVQVDGAESQLDVDGAGRYASPQVTIP